jgi:FixJ family two-component response regulator
VTIYRCSRSKKRCSCFACNSDAFRARLKPWLSGRRMDEQRQLIVILEDDAGMRRAVERLLQMSGFRTCSFQAAEESNVQEAAAHAACLVVDVQLPGLSGPAFYGALSPPRPPAIFITAHDEPSTQRAMAQFAQPVLLTKPFLGTALLDAINNVTQRTA